MIPTYIILLSILTYFIVGGETFSLTNIFSRDKDAHPIIITENGKIRGKKSKTVGEKKKYYAFLGIPFAEPPLKNLRFKPPQHKPKWNETLDTTKEKSICLQQGLLSKGSEDCLYLNLYTPNFRKNVPVMVWIYGGGFRVGKTDYKTYGPDYLLDEGVIFVSVNYRLDIFGYGSTEDSVYPGNLGIKDIIFALQWIQRNIRNFGGDPEKVTVFGYSAGAVAISYMMQTKLASGLFRGAIMESGTSLCIWALNRKSREAMFAIGEALKINTSDSKTLIEGLRETDAKSIEHASLIVSTNATLSNILDGLVFGPVKEHGVIHNHSEKFLSEGQFQRVPVIIGFNSNECAFLGYAPKIIKFYNKIYEKDITKMVPVDLTKNKTKISAAATKIKNYYFNGKSKHNIKDLVKFCGDDQFFRPIRKAVLDQSKYVPVYFYKFSHVGALSDSNQGDIQGASHTEETNYLFRRDRFYTPSDDILVRSRIVKLWTNFAKYTNPTPTKDSLFQNITWTPSKPTANKLTYLNISTNIELLQNPFDEDMRFWDDIYREYGDPPYDTY